MNCSIYNCVQSPDFISTITEFKHINEKELRCTIALTREMVAVKEGDNFREKFRSKIL